MCLNCVSFLSLLKALKPNSNGGGWHVSQLCQLPLSSECLHEKLLLHLPRGWHVSQLCQLPWCKGLSASPTQPPFPVS